MKQEEVNFQRIQAALEYIGTHFQDQPDLETIASQVHLSPFHFQRMFEKWAGVSPKKFLQYLTLKYARQKLKEGASVLDAAYASGLSGTGRIHDLFVTLSAVSPGEYKNGGENMVISYSFVSSPFGELILAETQRGICNLMFIDSHKRGVEDLRIEWPKAQLKEQAGKQAAAIAQFFSEKERAEKPIHLHLKGSSFQIQVWEALLKIPRGNLVAYGDIARHIGKPRASRAVGTAIGANPIAYLIPCHRVIKSVGAIGEYRWGKGRKMALVGWENSHVMN